MNVMHHQNQKMHGCNKLFWNGFTVCLPSTAHLLNVTAGEIPSTREKVHVHATKTNPYATSDRCIWSLKPGELADTAQLEQASTGPFSNRF